MTRYDHAQASPADAEWLDGRLASAAELPRPSPADRLLVVAAHPDDETLGAGGLIAAAHAQGTPVTVVVATDGEASHPHSPTHPPEVLARRRRAEVQDAVTCLAPGTSVHFLGLPDGRLAEFPDALSAQVECFAREATHVVAPWEGDRHPDHAACARAADRAARQHRLVCWQYPIWAWHWADPGGDDLPWTALRRLPLHAADLAAKRQAVACHVSQHAALSEGPGDEPILTAGMLAHFERAFETFVLASTSDASEPAFFDALYANSDDPWQLGDRFYEQRKRSLLLAALPRRRFHRAFEPGCATGLITEELAARCEQVVAWDVADRALVLAKQRLEGAAHVLVEQRAIPDDWPQGRFDLIVLSEVGYYCGDLARLEAAVFDSLSEDGVLVACHWHHFAASHPHTAEAVHSALARRLTPVVTHLEDDFLLNVWTVSGRSVAAETGIVP